VTQPLGVAAVLSRMASIEARFGVARPPAASTTVGGASFDGVLSEVLSSTTTAAPLTNGDRIVSVAKEYLGVPYVWGGTDPSTGLDCSGFVLNVFRRLGVELPRVSRDQANAGQPVASMAEARPGDLLFFNS